MAAAVENQSVAEEMEAAAGLRSVAEEMAAAVDMHFLLWGEPEDDRDELGEKEEDVVKMPNPL